MKNLIRVLLALALALNATLMLDARIKDVQRERNFALKIDEKPFVIVLFYNTDKASRESQRMIRYLKRDLQYVVEAGLYQNARVSLLALDIGHDNLESVAARYAITSYPSIVLFKDGETIKNKEGRTVALRGFVSRNEIREFIDKHMRDDVLDFMEDQYNKSQRAQMDRTHIYFSYGMTLPASVEYGYPYYYSPYTYYGVGAPGLGVELGF